MRKLVLDGIARLRLEQALSDYESGEINLGEAAKVAGVSVRRMMAEVDRRGIDLSRDGDLATSLETLAGLLDGAPELRETIAELRARTHQHRAATSDGEIR